MSRYVPKTYNNRRVLRIIIGTFIAIVLTVVIAFMILFFVFQTYFVDGRLDIPWLDNPPPITTPTPETD